MGLGDLMAELLGEIEFAELASPEWAGHRFTSVFFGGGTPTTLGSDALAALLEHLRREFDVAPDAEVTTEANPDTVDQPLLERLLAAAAPFANVSS